MYNFPVHVYNYMFSWLLLLPRILCIFQRKQKPITMVWNASFFKDACLAFRTFFNLVFFLATFLSKFLCFAKTGLGENEE